MGGIGESEETVPHSPSKSSVVWGSVGGPEELVGVGHRISISPSGDYRSPVPVPCDIPSHRHYSPVPPMAGFHVKRVAVMDTDLSKDISSWKVIESIPLQHGK